MAARRRKGRKPARPKPAARKPAKRSLPPRSRTARRKASAQAPRKATPRKPKSRRPPAKPALPGDRRVVAGASLEIGTVLHYYPRAGAAVVLLSRPIHRGDRIFIRGQTTDFVQSVTALALDGAAVAEAGPPREAGVQLEQRARARDRAFRAS